MKFSDWTDCSCRLGQTTPFRISRTFQMKKKVPFFCNFAKRKFAKLILENTLFLRSFTRAWSPESHDSDGTGGEIKQTRSYWRALNIADHIWGQATNIGHIFQLSGISIIPELSLYYGAWWSVFLPKTGISTNKWVNFHFFKNLLPKKPNF